MAGIVIAFLLIALIDIPPLVIGKKRGTVVVLCALLAVGLFVGISYNLTKQMQSPIELITNFMQKFFEGG